MGKQPFRIIIADDHSLIRKGLRTIIELEQDMRIIGEAADGIELMRLLRHGDTPDLIILDISMPGINGIEAIDRILERHPDVRILMLTMHRNNQYFYNAFSAGAHGYLMKDDSDTELMDAIRTVLAGKTYVSPLLSREVTHDILSAFCRRQELPVVKLTSRERDVLRLLVKGHTSREMAEILCLSPRTVDHHRARLLKKFNKKNSVDLVKHVVEGGIIATE